MAENMGENMGENNAPVPSQAETLTTRVPCAISGELRPRKDLISLETLRPALVDRIHRDYPALAQDALISRQAADKFRTIYVEELLKAEHGEFSELDRQVADSIAKQDTIAENIEEQFEERRTFGESLSDQLASFGGSWGFLMAFFVLLAIWIAYNLIRGEAKAFDVYPFILLNLILSCLAAIQAPIIMMS